MRVALVTDWLDSFGGGERVLMELHRMFPDAPIYTSVHKPAGLPPELRGLDVRTSFIQRLPWIRGSHLRFLPLMPLAFESFDLRGYDLVVSTSSACAKGVITAPGTVHVCYCHTPCRYVWDLYHDYVRGRAKRVAAAPVAHYLRLWDRMASDRVDFFVANSREVAGRIRKHYRRESTVVSPPVDVERIRPDGRAPDDYYLVVSRLVEYKRVDLAVRAATRLGRRLVVAGQGPEMEALKAMAGPTVEFRGFTPDDALPGLYARCRAFLFPGFEDFGITPVEAQAAGRPVVAYGRGGAAETVLDGVTGVLFGEQTVESLCEAILRLEQGRFDPAACRRNAERYGPGAFREGMRAVMEQAGLPAPAASRSLSLAS